MPGTGGGDSLDLKFSKGPEHALNRLASCRLMNN